MDEASSTLPQALKLQNTWLSMVQRCTNPKATGYRNYGGRGITICDRWLRDMRAFMDDVIAEIGPPPTFAHTLDRRDNNGPYEPGNIRWATRAQQNRNKRKAEEMNLPVRDFSSSAQLPGSGDLGSDDMNLLPVVAGQPKTALTVSLETSLENASRYALASKSDASKRAYTADWKSFSDWCAARQLEPMPAEIESVVSYLADSANQGLKRPTIRRRAAALAYFHRLKGHPSPTEHELVKAVLAGIARELGSRTTKKAPITVDVVKKLIRQIPPTKIGLRDRVVLLLGFAGAFRRSELVAINVEDLEHTDDGLIVHIRKSKTDQTGEGRIVAIPRGGRLRTLEAIEEWIKAANIETGRLLRNVAKSGVIGDSLTDRSIANIVKQYAEAAGLDPALFSGHSLRAGFVTTALDHGADPFAVMDVTGHKEPRTLKVYDRRSRFTKHAGRSFL